MLTLYFAPGSSSMAAHIALYEVGLPFEARPISFNKREQREPWFLALNPLGTVPLLLIDGQPLIEVAAILFYLARRCPDARLWPEAQLDAQAHIVSWMSFIASSVHPALRRGEEYVRKIYTHIEDRMSDTWLTGDYSIADIHLFRLFWRASHTLTLDPADFPKLYAHRTRMLERPAVQKTIEVESAIGYEILGFRGPTSS